MSTIAIFRERILQNAKDAEAKAIASDNDEEMIIHLDARARFQKLLEEIDGQPVDMPDQIALLKQDIGQVA